MWQCVKCREKLADDFEVCWKCGTSSAGVEDSGFPKADDKPAEEIDDSPATNAPSATDESTAIRVISEADTSKPQHHDYRPLDCPPSDRALSFAKGCIIMLGVGLIGSFAGFFIGEAIFDTVDPPTKAVGHSQGLRGFGKMAWGFGGFLVGGIAGLGVGALFRPANTIVSSDNK